MFASLNETSFVAKFKKPSVGQKIGAVIVLSKAKQVEMMMKEEKLPAE